MDRKKILVVDDDPEMRLALQARLEANNYDVFFAEDGVASIREARKHSPQLVLLDLDLPAGDGFTVLKWLKENQSLSSIPTIVISGRQASGNKERALKAGAKAFLQKPVESTQVLSVIAHCLDNTRPAKIYDLKQ